MTKIYIEEINQSDATDLYFINFKFINNSHLVGIGFICGEILTVTKKGKGKVFVVIFVSFYIELIIFKVCFPKKHFLEIPFIKI